MSLVVSSMKFFFIFCSFSINHIIYLVNEFCRWWWWKFFVIHFCSCDSVYFSFGFISCAQNSLFAFKIALLFPFRRVFSHIIYGREKKNDLQKNDVNWNSNTQIHRCHNSLWRILMISFDLSCCHFSLSYLQRLRHMDIHGLCTSALIRIWNYLWKCGLQKKKNESNNGSKYVMHTENQKQSFSVIV